MKTLIKSAILILTVLLTYSWSFSQTDTSKNAMERTVDKVEKAFDGDRADVDHNHSALMEHIDDLMEKVENMEYTGDFDKDYANMMIEYNQTGVDIAQVEVMKGENDNLKAKARETIDWQKDEIDRLKEFLGDYKDSGKKHDVSILKSAVKEKLAKMHQIKVSGDVDKDFAKIMNLHHEGAIDLHNLQLEHGMSAQLKEHANNSIKAQQSDMAELKEFDDIE